MTAGIPGGSIILTPTQARILYQVANLKDLRTRYRGGDQVAYAVLLTVTECAFHADSGNEPRQSAASEEREVWTVRQIAARTGKAERTIRLDIETNRLPARKVSGAWVITAADAQTYIESRKRN